MFKNIKSFLQSTNIYDPITDQYSYKKLNIKVRTNENDCYIANTFGEGRIDYFALGVFSFSDYDSEYDIFFKFLNFLDNNLIVNPHYVFDIKYFNNEINFITVWSFPNITVPIINGDFYVAEEVIRNLNHATEIEYKRLI